MSSRAAVRIGLMVLASMAGGTPWLLAQEAEEGHEPQAAAAPPQAKPAAAPKPGVAATAPALPAKPVTNVRVDVKITDLRGGQAAATKAVSLTIANGENGSTRSIVEAQWGKTDQFRSSQLKIDARPDIVESHRIRLRLSLEYNLSDPVDIPKPPVTHMQESLTFILEDGRPLVVAESAEPSGDRQVRLEVTATIVR
jgi:hypothetical protein